jgi:eukaryotic-like serine/threonine-protein kinase
VLVDRFDSAAGVREGDILAGKYRVERVLGMGGMGVVVAAHHLQLDEKVALKFLLPDALDNTEAVARFAREARAAVKIKSEHVARIIDVGTLPNGAPYMVMEHLDGGDLAAWLLDRGPLSIEQAVEFVLQASEAVAEAHALGIVHRDLKPANLFCIRRADGRLSVKVLDFGISKVTQFGASGVSALTHDAALVGSPLYMSPEQMKSANTVDSLTDIWALGVILYELLTGKVPFVSESLPEQVHRVTTEPPSSLRGIRPEVPVDLEAVILCCLEKDRSKRYHNVAELALALYPFAPIRARGSVERISDIIQASGQLASARTLVSSRQDASTLLSAGTLPPLGRTTAGRTTAEGAPGRKLALVKGGVGAAAILVAIVTVAIWKRGSTHHDDSPSVAAQSASAAVSLQVPAVEPVPSPPPALTAATTVPIGVAASNAAPAVRPVVIAPKPSAPVASKPTFAASSSSRTAPLASPPPIASPSSNANCEPSYFYDVEGNKHFKPECFGH